jgi:hypothetical protein
MNKFGLYSKTNLETNQHINVCNMPTASQAEAYFAGVKQLTLEQFRNLFIVKEINDGPTNRGLIYGNS